HRLNLISLEEPGEFVLILRDHPSEGNGQIVAERKIGFTTRFVLAAFQDFENKLVALFAVLAKKSFDVLERRCFQRFEAIFLVHLANDPNHILASSTVVREKISCSAGRLRGHQSTADLKACATYTPIDTRHTGRRTAGCRPLLFASAAASPCRDCPSPATAAARASPR